MGIHLWVFGLNQSFMPILEIINFESFHRNVEWGGGGDMRGSGHFFPFFCYAYFISLLYAFQIIFAFLCPMKIVAVMIFF